MSLAKIRLGLGALRELRIHLCQKSAASSGVREFMDKDYVPLKQSNPSFPILVRECSGIAPSVWARYEHGVETSVSLEDAPREKVSEVIAALASQAPTQ